MPESENKWIFRHLLGAMPRCLFRLMQKGLFLPEAAESDHDPRIFLELSEYHLFYFAPDEVAEFC